MAVAPRILVFAGSARTESFNKKLARLAAEAARKAGTTNTPATITMHGLALQTNYISETGNYVGKTTMPEVGRTQSWFLLWPSPR